MAEYDRLPAPLRAWLQEARLPWSPRSALKAWQKAEREFRGDLTAMRARLDRIEQGMLSRETACFVAAGRAAQARSGLPAGIGRHAA